MKKIISTLVIITAIITSPQHAFTQAAKDTGKDVFAYNSVSPEDPFSLFNDKKYFPESRLNDINIKAVRDFINSFKDVTNEKWYSISDGFIASFTKAGIQTKVVYDLQGVRHCTLRAFNEKQMPEEIRNMVKSKYYDFNILVGYEVKYDSGSIYIIKIDNTTKLKILKITNEEIEVIGDYTKG
jgi:hypothetical protein